MCTLLGTSHLSASPKHENLTTTQYQFDLADVKGQLRPRRALEIAAAGGHSLLLKVHLVQVKHYWLLGYLLFCHHSMPKKI
jgi:predicted ATPase with chaperone activity